MSNDCVVGEDKLLFQHFNYTEVETILFEETDGDKNAYHALPYHPFVFRKTEPFQYLTSIRFPKLAKKFPRKTDCLFTFLRIVPAFVFRKPMLAVPVLLPHSINHFVAENVHRPRRLSKAEKHSKPVFTSSKKRV